MADILQEASPRSDEFQDPCKLWMGNLSPYMDEAFIKSAFKAHSFDIVAVTLVKNNLFKEPGHHCFLEFISADLAKSALQTLNHEPIPGCSDGKKFELKWASKSRDNSGEEHNLYVGNLSAEVDTSELLEFFQANYPSVVSAKVVSNEDGSSQGFGFVRFLDADERDRSIAELDGLTIVGTKPVTMRTSEPPQPQSSGLHPAQGQSPAVYAYGGYVYGTKTNQANYHEDAQHQPGAGAVSITPYSSYTANHTTGQTGSTPETPVDVKQVAHSSVPNAVLSSGIAHTTTNTNGGHTPVSCTSLDVTNEELIAREKRLFEVMQEAKWDLQFNRKIMAASAVAGLHKH